MKLETTIQKAAEAVLADHLAPKLAKEISQNVADACLPAVRQNLLAMLGVSDAELSAQPKPKKTNGHVKAEEKTDDIAGPPRELRTASVEVMSLKKSLGHAKRRAKEKAEAQENDAVLLANEERINNLTSSDFEEKGLTASTFIAGLHRAARKKNGGGNGQAKKNGHAKAAKNGKTAAHKGELPADVL